MLDSISGRIWVFGEDIDTDVIYPGKYLPILEADEMAKHALEGYDPQFPSRLQKGDIIVAGMGFGCGSSREQAATCLKAAGVAAIVAGSFARIFFRNAVNQGLPLVQADIGKLIKDGEEIHIDFNHCQIKVSEKVITFPPLANSVMDILAQGGLIPAVRRKLGLN